MTKQLRVTVEGKTYDVTVELLGGSSTPTPAAAPVASAPVASASVTAPATTAAKPKPAAGSDAVTSPLAGKVVAVAAQPGQQVKEGDQLLTLEAMKMNTFVFAPRDGTVAQVHVSPGDAVDEGQALVTLS
jgi:biotin carboxyl carrier protein